MSFSKDTPVSYVVEGAIDAAVVRTLLREANLVPGDEIICRGKGRLDTKLSAYNNAARFTPWFVVRDLDSDAACASVLVREILPDPAEHMCLRISVREIEVWLMADFHKLAEFLHVPSSRIPKSPEVLNDPKGEILNLVRKSRVRWLRQAMLPVEGSGISVGPEYVSIMSEFAERFWSPKRAIEFDRSDSLGRAFRRLEHFASLGRWKVSA